MGRRHQFGAPATTMRGLKVGVRGLVTRVLTGLLGRPTFHLGGILSWLLHPAPGPGDNR